MSEPTSESTGPSTGPSTGQQGAQPPGRAPLQGPGDGVGAKDVPLTGGPLGWSRAKAELASPDGEVGRRGMFSGSGDTSGFGGLVVQRPEVASTPRPLGGWFDEVVDALEAHFGADTFPLVLVDRGELTLHVQRDRVADVCSLLRDDPALRFELLSNLSGVDYLGQAERLHVVYNLTSMTWRRRLRLEVSCTVEDPHVPTVTWVYPTADWMERETWDFFGVVFDGHPALTRIQMPDDWPGHPQRKDYPLGGVPVEYKGAQIPPPDERRAYA